MYHWQSVSLSLLFYHYFVVVFYLKSVAHYCSVCAPCFTCLSFSFHSSLAFILLPFFFSPRLVSSLHFASLLSPHTVLCCHCLCPYRLEPLTKREPKAVRDSEAGEAGRDERVWPSGADIWPRLAPQTIIL